jgi:hypothetical protein
MTRKHFEAIASIIKANLDISDHMVERQAIKVVAMDMADYFAGQNPLFDRQRFLKACVGSK